MAHLVSEIIQQLLLTEVRSGVAEYIDDPWCDPTTLAEIRASEAYLNAKAYYEANPTKAFLIVHKHLNMDPNVSLQTGDYETGYIVVDSPLLWRVYIDLGFTVVNCMVRTFDHEFTPQMHDRTHIHLDPSSLVSPVFPDPDEIDIDADPKLAALKASILAEGIQNPIIVYLLNSVYTIQDGNKRWLVGLKLGLTSVPVDLKDYDG